MAKNVLIWRKSHKIPGLGLSVQMESTFPKGTQFGGAVESDLKKLEMIYPLNCDPDNFRKVYLPAEYGTGAFFFVPQLDDPEPIYHALILYRKTGQSVFMTCGRHGEEEAFGFSKWKEGDPRIPDYQPLAFPNITGRFPDTFILLEKKKACGEYLVVKISSDFANPQKFEAGKPVVVSWQVVDLAEAPECLKRAAENRREEVKNMEEALKQAMAAKNIMRP